jgi:hypothetical protein
LLNSRISRHKPRILNCGDQTNRREGIALIGSPKHRSNRLKSAKDTGELPSEFDAESVAQIIATYLQGLFRTTAELRQVPA